MSGKYSIEDLVNRLNLTRGTNGWYNGHCPHPGHDDLHPSFSATLSPTGRLITHCHVCTDQQSVRQAAIAAMEEYFTAQGGHHDQQTCAPEAEPQTDDAKAYHCSNQERALEIWEDAELDTTIASGYLKTRGLSGETPLSIRQADLEYAPRSGERYPTMIAAIMNCQNQIVGIHRTFLQVNPDGSVVKAPVEKPKKAMGSVTGGAVHLREPLPGMETLHLTEGIETGLGVQEALPLEVVWATLSAQNLATVILPAGIKKLFIWADRDRSGAGEDWAEKAAKLFSSQGIKVFVLVPPGPIPDGQKSVDWLDMGPDAIVEAFENATEFVASNPWDQWSLPSGYTMDKQGVFLDLGLRVVEHA